MFKGSLNDTHHSGFFDEFGDVFKGFVPVAKGGEHHWEVDARDDRHFVVFQHAVRDIGGCRAHHVRENEGAVRIFFRTERRRDEAGDGIGVGIGQHVERPDPVGRAFVAAVHVHGAVFERLCERRMCYEENGDGHNTFSNAFRSVFSLTAYFFGDFFDGGQCT